jgi:hypothetical protein
MLGVDEGFQDDPTLQREIQGPGYLAADVPLLTDIPQRIARSMLYLNGKRLRLQERHGMADRRTRQFHQRAREELERSQAPDASALASTLHARSAVTYTTLNNPVLRRTIREAVNSILWYLCLLVPFAIFFEKLAMGFTDVRKQLMASAIIFLISFGLLAVLHPAFEMIRSSLMVLLGFVIILISLGITALFAGKFRENLEGLRSRRGIVTAAEVNKMGVASAAFMLGLNNMHRRKVRTGLTCATLVLITFAMICFTSVQSDLVDSAVAIGKAPYQGLLIRDENLRPMQPGEVQALRARFGHRFDISVRTMAVGAKTWTRETVEPRLTVTYQDGGQGRSVALRSVMEFSVREPLARHLAFVTETGWFDEATGEADPFEPAPVALPDTAAARLGITPEQVDAGTVTVDINGRTFRVHSLFDAAQLGELRDLDDRDILPFDIRSMPQVRTDAQDNALAVEPYARIRPEDVLLALDIGDLPIGPYIQPRTTSVAIWLREPQTGMDLAYKDAREVINTFLEQSGRSTYYGLDGVAYRGRRTRASQLGGLGGMIIPLVIAALTVLNTMKGSVYERRGEIFVYNAVGIAPRYIFLMFFAEAFVYAVVGSVLGYLLSQGTGQVLTALGLAGGLTLTFTSYTTILASVAIALAVFASTFFPALSAVRIAAPAEHAGWALPEPEGDRLVMNLPFTFDGRSRVAVLEFFRRLLLDHGEGSSGRFFASEPIMDIDDQTDPLDRDAYIPRLCATIWLKPYDLGVSQQLEIALPTDAETGEYIARLTLTRLSGRQEAWLRLNHGLLERIRQHFLHWRAVGPDQREEMFQAARGHLAAALTPAGGFHG